MAKLLIFGLQPTYYKASWITQGRVLVSVQKEWKTIGERSVSGLGSFGLFSILPFLKKSSMLDKLFGKGKKKSRSNTDPSVSFGRYSDNNKPLPKVARWTDAENFFKERKYTESLDAFFDYLRDDAMQNVKYERSGTEGRFEFFQGSKMVRGSFDKEQLNAEVTLARMPQPSVPVMRRLLEMNFSLFYSRYAMDSERLCMRFDSEIESASPSKLYYGLKELAIKADKQDDLLVQDFTILEAADDEHLLPVSLQQKEVKFNYLQQWIRQTLDTIASVDADKFSGGISYMLLSLIYRIDYLITPEGKLLNDLEKISGIYFKKDERPVTDKNRDMIAEFKKMLDIPKEEVFNYLIHSKHTFSIVAPQPYKTIADSIRAANQNMTWYKDNNYPFIACQVIEYGISYCQYSYSLPKAVTELFHVYMMVNYPGYFMESGFQHQLYDPARNKFDKDGITDRIKEIQSRWKEKYPAINFNTQNLKFDNLVNFDHSFTTELENLNMEGK